jgi:RNA polymerase sigma factor (sigma-70 family)
VDGNEGALIGRAQAGDRAAYEELLRPLVGPASRLAFAMLYDRSEADDVFQEAAIRGWQRLRNLRPGTSFRPWFLGIVANQSREVRRGRWWQTLRLPDLALLAAPAEPDAWLQGEDLRRALRRLPAPERVAILMHFHLDLPLAEVAAALGLTVPAIKARINRGLRRLRSALVVSEEARINDA